MLERRLKCIETLNKHLESGDIVIQDRNITLMSELKSLEYKADHKIEANHDFILDMMILKYYD